MSRFYTTVRDAIAHTVHLAGPWIQWHPCEHCGGNTKSAVMRFCCMDCDEHARSVAIHAAEAAHPVVRYLGPIRSVPAQTVNEATYLYGSPA